MHHFPAYVKGGLKDMINNYSHCDTRSFANSSLKAFSQEKLNNKILKLILKIWINFDHQNYIKLCFSILFLTNWYRRVIDNKSNLRPFANWV